MKKGTLVLLFMLSQSIFSQSKTLPEGCVQYTPEQMPWVGNVPNLPPGTQFCALYGDIKKQGPFAVRLQLQPNIALKNHYHKQDEVVTVLEGSVSVSFPGQPAHTFGAGSFYVNAAHTEHAVQVGPQGATLQINAQGPWTVIFK